jgi:tetratricopeptide (TPR) repeat protein
LARTRFLLLNDAVHARAVVDVREQGHWLLDHFDRATEVLSPTAVLKAYKLLILNYVADARSPQLEFSSLLEDFEARARDLKVGHRRSTARLHWVSHWKAGRFSDAERCYQLWKRTGADPLEEDTELTVLDEARWLLTTDRAGTALEVLGPWGLDGAFQHGEAMSLELEAHEACGDQLKADLILHQLIALLKQRQGGFTQVSTAVVRLARKGEVKRALGLLEEHAAWRADLLGTEDLLKHQAALVVLCSSALRTSSPWRVNRPGRGLLVDPQSYLDEALRQSEELLTGLEARGSSSWLRERFEKEVALEPLPPVPVAALVLAESRRIAGLEHNPALVTCLDAARALTSPGSALSLGLMRTLQVRTADEELVEAYLSYAQALSEVDRVSEALELLAELKGLLVEAAHFRSSGAHRALVDLHRGVDEKVEETRRLVADSLGSKEYDRAAEVLDEVSSQLLAMHYRAGVDLLRDLVDLRAALGEPDLQFEALCDLAQARGMFGEVAAGLEALDEATSLLGSGVVRAVDAATRLEQARAEFD